MAPKKGRATMKKKQPCDSSFSFAVDPIATSSPSSSTIGGDTTINVLSDALYTSRSRIYEKSLNAYEQNIENLRAKSKETLSLIQLELGSQLLDSVFEVIQQTNSRVKTVNGREAVKESINSRMPRKVLADINGSFIEHGAFSKPKGLRRSSSASRVNDESNKQKGPFHDNDVFKKPKVRLRSASHSRISTSSYMTPVVKRPRGCYNIATVTPGPNINRAFSVMRRPNVGETAISLTGSPLLVSTDASSASMPCVNVPIDDKILSIFPRDGFSCDDLPELSDTTKEQLKILREYLNNMQLP